MTLLTREDFLKQIGQDMINAAEALMSDPLYEPTEFKGIAARLDSKVLIDNKET